MKESLCPIPSDRYFLTMNETCKVFNKSRSTITREENKNLFPKRVKITTNDVCFYEKNLCTNFIPPNNLEIKYYKNYTIIESNYQYHGSW